MGLPLLLSTLILTLALTLSSYPYPIPYPLKALLTPSFKGRVGASALGRAGRRGGEDEQTQASPNPLGVFLRAKEGGGA